MRAPPPPWPCVVDATKLGGLSDLRRRHPERWHRIMRRFARDVDATATVAEAMRAGGNGMLLPKHPSARAAQNLKAKRSAAALLVRELGDVVLGDIDERWMREARAELAARGRPDRGTLSRAFTLLRKVAFRGQSRSGRRPKLAWKLRPKRRQAIGERPVRDVPHWDDVAQCIAKASSARVRAAVALQAHMGVSPGTVLALRVGHLDRQNHIVWAPVRGPRGRLVHVPYAIPHDAWRAVGLHLRRRPDRPDALLFPKRGAPDEPCPSISKAIQREARRLGFEDFTLQQVRRLAQAGLIEIGARREQVRGSVRKGRSGRRALSVQKLERQRHAWVKLRGGAAMPPSLRAPRDCAADQPERRFRRRNEAAEAEALPDTPVPAADPSAETPRSPTPALEWTPLPGAANYPDFSDLSLPELTPVAAQHVQPQIVVQVVQPPPFDADSVFGTGAVFGAATTLALAKGVRQLSGEDDAGA